MYPRKAAQLQIEFRRRVSFFSFSEHNRDRNLNVKFSMVRSSSDLIQRRSTEWLMLGTVFHLFVMTSDDLTRRYFSWWIQRKLSDLLLHLYNINNILRVKSIKQDNSSYLEVNPWSVPTLSIRSSASCHVTHIQILSSLRDDNSKLNLILYLNCQLRTSEAVCVQTKFNVQFNFHQLSVHRFRSK